MKKIKFLIASMLGAIALVFACVLGTRVNAANADVALGLHTWYVDTNYTGENNKDNKLPSKVGGVDTYDIFTIVENNKKQDFSSLGSDLSHDSTMTDSDYQTKSTTWASHGEMQIGGSSRGVKVTIGDSQVGTFELYVYTTKTGENARNISVNGATGTNISAVNTVQKITGNLVGGENTILSNGDKVAFLELDVTVSSNTKTVTRLSVSNSAVYNLGDAFDTSKLTVTATYDDSTTGPLSSDKYNVSITNDVTTFTAAGTYTVTVTLKTNNEIYASCNIEIKNAVLYKFYNSTHTDGNDLTVATNITLKAAKKRTDRTNIFNGNTIANYMQSAEIDFTLDNKASVEFYITQTASTTNVNDRTYYIKDSEGNIIEGTGFTPAMKTKNSGDVVSTYQTIVLPSGTYKLLSPCGTLNMYGMKIDYDTTENAIDTTNFVNFEWQFDNVQTPSKIRFVGTINNVADLSKLTNVKVTMVLKKVANADKDTSYAGTIDMPKVYSKVMNGTDVLKDKVDNTYYAVCVMSGLDTLKTTLNGKDATNGWMIEAKLNYTYDGVSYIVSASGNITLIAKAS